MIDIKNIRKARNETQKQFAEAVGCSLRTVETWERGQQPKYFEKLLEIILDIYIDKRNDFWRIDEDENKNS